MNEKMVDNVRVNCSVQIQKLVAAVEAGLHIWGGSASVRKTVKGFRLTHPDFNGKGRDHYFKTAKKAILEYLIFTDFNVFVTINKP